MSGWQAPTPPAGRGDPSCVDSTRRTQAFAPSSSCNFIYVRHETTAYRIPRATIRRGVQPTLASGSDGPKPDNLRTAPMDRVQLHWYSLLACEVDVYRLALRPQRRRRGCAPWRFQCPLCASMPRGLRGHSRPHEPAAPAQTPTLQTRLRSPLLAERCALTAQGALPCRTMTVIFGAARDFEYSSTHH